MPTYEVHTRHILFNSRQIVSYEKSYIKFSPNTQASDKDNKKKWLGMKNEQGIGNYLGCSMDEDGRSNTEFKPIIEKIKKLFLKILKLNTTSQTYSNKHDSSIYRFSHNDYIFTPTKINKTNHITSIKIPVDRGHEKQTYLLGKI